MFREGLALSGKEASHYWSTLGLVPVFLGNRSTTMTEFIDVLVLSFKDLLTPPRLTQVGNWTLNMGHLFWKPRDIMTSHP